MPAQDVILVDIIQNVVASMQVVAYPATDPVSNFTIYYEPGRSNDIIKSIADTDNSITLKGEKYPLFAMILPIKEERGNPGFYGFVRIPRIVIATMTKSEDGTEAILDKYDANGTFKKILYPLYKEFLKRLAMSPNVNCSDPDSFVHEKMDIQGQQLTDTGVSTDYVDSIEILNLEFYLLQSKTC